MKKSIDVITQRMFGLAAIIFALCFGIATITNNSVKADHPGTINETGKIMMDQNTIVHEGKIFYHILAWDTETGKSKMYYQNTSDGSYKTSSNQLPSSPIY
jgi:hypothetical protein